MSKLEELYKRKEELGNKIYELEDKLMKALNEYDSIKIAIEDHETGRKH